jgi:hypothetical protein
MKNVVVCLFSLILQSVFVEVCLFRSFFHSKLLPKYEGPRKLHRFGLLPSKSTSKTELPYIDEAESLFKWTFHKYPQDFIVRYFLFVIFCSLSYL